MKRCNMALLIAIFSVTCAFATIEGDFKFIKTYANTAGAVTFNHTNHTERFTDECGFCHSALKTFGGTVDKMFGHKVCKVCHKSHNGPTECSQCHDGHKLAKK